MKDRFGRKIDYMRISITDRCNLRCRYCVPDNFETLSHFEILSYEEILSVCRAAVKLGINRFKITGGEPFTRKNCIHFLADLKAMPGVEQVTLTTNGLLLRPHLEFLKEIGIDGINISLDTCNPTQYSEITGADAFFEVMDAINTSLDLGIRTKINCVPLKNYNEDNLKNLMKLAKDKPLDVRFIEVMPIGGGKKFVGVKPHAIKRLIYEEYSDVQEIVNTRGNGPASYLQIKGFMGSIGFIEAIHNKFCTSCNRIRLTANGILKPCLYYDSNIDIREILRQNSKEEVDSLLQEKIEQAILEKNSEHRFFHDAPNVDTKVMSQIGG